MARIKPDEQLFKMSDDGFYLDARLTAIINGSAYDFMGKKIFTTKFFRENIGFGITNIDIEVNTSLQPIITITFKDLYGNAVFGKSVNKGLSSEDFDNTEISDFSALFNWPPPKFLFTFKGFLGRQVSWLLNLKQTSTTYQSDGSYDIKCEFVPNQWGFMADLPFLFLLAVKGLKKRELSPEDFRKARTIFDLIKIGKKVEIKTKSVTKEFDILMEQMTLLKSNRIVEAILYSSIIKFDETIDGSAGNSKVVGNGSLNFQSITIKTPTAPEINTIEKLKQYTSSSPEAVLRANNYLLLNSDIAGNSSNVSLNSDFQSLRGDISSKLTIIGNNIKVVEDAIKKRSFDASKSQLRQITIGEIFQQLAGDAGYIMGKILEVGLKGGRSAERGDKKGLIGKQFPLVLEDGKEIPYSEATVELEFVSDFITAISEGIAKDLTENTQNSPVGDENALVKRINNLEAIKGNPYAPFYRNIAENILVRAGIMAFLTRSNDPNYPGDFTIDTFDLGFDRDSVEEVTALAASDMENITTELLSSLPDDEFLKLKRFCIFWTKFMNSSGSNYLNDDGSDGSEVGGAEDALSREVIVDNTVNPPIKISLKRIVNSVFVKKGDPLGDTISGSDESFDSSNAAFINLNFLQAKAVYNNGILYSIPDNYVSDNSWTYVIFEGKDATKAKEVNSAASDAELKSSTDEDLDDNPIGFVQVNSYYGSGENSSEVLGRVEYINDRLTGANGAVLNYRNIANPTPNMFKDKAAYDSQVLYNTSTQIVPAVTEDNQLASRNLVYTVAYHHDDTTGGLVFGPFEDTTSSQNQRACIVRMCETVLDKMNQLEEEKNKVIASVLGNASEQRDALYKQFHVLYHQWESLLFSDPSNDECNEKIGASTPFDNASGVLQERYGGDSKHKTTKSKEDSGDKASQINLVSSNTFIYDYPLNTQAGIDVKKSIIDIEPLYKPDGNTTVLNMIQQLCTKNHFTFVPIPGNGDFNDYKEIFRPQISNPVELKNLFYIMFSPTPESRTKINNDSKETLFSNMGDWVIDQDVYEIRMGDPNNKIFKGVSIDTYENKASAESIINLQRLTDSENQNKRAGLMNCSMLPIMEGRSYKASFDMLGDAQVFPMQYFYLDSIPLFNGIYQVMKVKHNIKPNDMTTTAEGIRMRFSARELGGIQPITLDTLEELQVTEVEASTANGAKVIPVPSSSSSSVQTGVIPATDASSVVAGTPTGDYIKYEDLSTKAKFFVDQTDRLVVVREYATEKRTVGTMWYNKKVLGFTVEDVIRPVSSKVKDKTAIPKGNYNIALDTTGNQSLVRCYVKFPDSDIAKYRSPGVLPRVGTTANAVTLESYGVRFDGIRIHNGTSEGWSSGCIIYSSKRNADGTIKNDIPHCQALTKLIYEKGIKKITVTNEFNN